jgi:hypothetical protein
MDKQFCSARLKIERANKHILELNSVLDAFAKTDFYDFGVHNDANTGDDVLHFIIVVPFPETTALIVGDAIHNLRSALDLMICAIVERAGESTKHVKFPFGTEETREQFIGRVQKGTVKKCLPEPLWADILDVIKPYKGGNAAICAIHDLDILDKHILLIPVLSVASLTGVHVDDEASGLHMVNCTIAVHGNRSLSAIGWSGMLAKRPKLHIKDKGKATADILFQNGLPLQRQAIIPTLKQLSQLVSGIIERFEAVYFA